MLSWLNRLSKVTLICVGLFFVAIIGAVDYLTGVELSFSLFYILPLVLVSWHSDSRIGIPFAVLCAVVWAGADLLGGHIYSADYIFLFNTLVRLGLFIIITTLICKLQSSHEKFVQQALLAQKNLSVINTSRKLTTLIATNIATHNSNLWLWIAEQKKNGQRFPEIIETSCKNIGASLATLTEVCFSLQATEHKSIDPEELVNLIEERLPNISIPSITIPNDSVISPLQPQIENEEIVAIQETNSGFDYSILKN